VQKQTDILIQRLKQQPRFGRRIDDLDKNIDKQQQAYFDNSIESLMKRLPGVNTLFEQYAEKIKAANTENNKLGMGLNNVLAIQTEFANGITTSTKQITVLEQTVGKLTKGYGLSLKRANDVSKKFRDIAIASGIGEDKLYDYANSLKDVTSGFLTSDKASAGFQKKLLLGQQYMQNNLEITEDAAQGYEYYATSVAKSGAEALLTQNELAKSIAAATGLDELQVQKQLTEDIGGLTADLQLQYSRIPGSLELAVLKSKALGMSMENLHNAGETLLNIESSIGSEMEYQLLTGKRLLTTDNKSLTNAYRMATIQGNANKQAELMNRFIETQGPMLEKNLYARKKAAELMGVDESVLARSIQKQKLLTELGAKSLMNLKGDDYMKEVLKLRKEAQERGEEDTVTKINDLIKSSDLRSTDQQMADNIAVIAAITAKGAGLDLVKVREDALKTGKSFEDVLQQFDDSSVMKTIGEVGIASSTVEALNAGFRKLTTWAGKFGETLDRIIQKYNSYLVKPATLNPADATKTTNKDAIIMNDGVIRFHQDDKFMRVNDSTMIAGTNVDGNRQLARAINGGGSIDYAKMAQAIAMALQNVKVEAKVTQDMLFAATKMNDRRRF
jgi:hypothetical protein